MSVVAKMRNQSGLLMGILVSGFLLAFILSSGSIRFFSSFFQGNADSVGSVSGKSINRYEYAAQIERMKSIYKSKIDDKILQDQVWYNIVQQIVLQKECDDLHIMITYSELIDIVQGENISPRVKSTFVNPDTKLFDKQLLISYLQSLPKMSRQDQVSWHNFENSLLEFRKQEKFLNIIHKSIYVTSKECKFRFDLDNREAVINYLYIPYSAISNSDEIISDSEIKKYIEQNKNLYQVEESLKVKYLVFSVNPTDEDIDNWNNEVRQICEDFANAKDDISFAKINTDSDINDVVFKFDSDNIPDIFKNKMLTVGTIVGPIHSASVCRIYKISDQIVDNGKTKYTIAVIEKKLVPGESARNAAYMEATRCVSACKKVVDLEKYASDNGLFMLEDTLNKNEIFLSRKYKARHLVKSLYSDSIGKVSNVFEVDNVYIVAVVTDKIEKGTAPMSLIKEDIVEKLRNKHKGELLLRELQKIEINSLQELNTTLGHRGNYLEKEKVKFSDNSLSQIPNSKRVVGASFGLQVGEKRIILDDFGVFVIELDSIEDKYYDNMVEFKQNLIKTKTNKNLYISLNAMEEIAKVVDERHKYY